MTLQFVFFECFLEFIFGGTKPGSRTKFVCLFLGGREGKGEGLTSCILGLG